MSDALVMSQLAGAAPVAPPAVSVAPVATVPDDEVVERFRGILAAPAQLPDPPASLRAQPPAQPASNIGDAILNGIRNVSGELTTAWNRVHAPAGMDKDLMSSARLVEMQRDVLTFSFLYEVVGKGISKSIQNLDSLVKMQ